VVGRPENALGEAFAEASQDLHDRIVRVSRQRPFWAGRRGMIGRDRWSSFDDCPWPRVSSSHIEGAGGAWEPPGQRIALTSSDRSRLSEARIAAAQR